MNTDPKTVEETVKALRSCTDASCEKCGLFGKCNGTFDAAVHISTDLIESMQSQLADYHPMSELVDGKMAENQRLRRINENLQEQLAESQRRADAVEMNEDNRVRLLQYDNLRKCFSELCDLILGRKYYNEAMDAYRADEFCCRDIWDKVKPMLSRKQWRGPQEAGKGGPQ